MNTRICELFRWQSCCFSAYAGACHDRYKLLIGATAAAFALSVLPASAQRPGGPWGRRGRWRWRSDRGSGGAVAGGGGGKPAGAGVAAEVRAAAAAGVAAVVVRRAPRHRAAAAHRERRAGHPSRAALAVQTIRAPHRRPRRPAWLGHGASRGTARVEAESAGGSNNSDRASAPAERAVPTYSRPRQGRTATGTAVDRQFPPYRGGGDHGYRYNPYYGYSRYYAPVLRVRPRLLHV